MKKYARFFILFALILSLLILGGCGKEKNDTDLNAEDGTTSAAGIQSSLNAEDGTTSAAGIQSSPDGEDGTTSAAGIQSSPDGEDGTSSDAEVQSSSTGTAITSLADFKEMKARIGVPTDFMESVQEELDAICPDAVISPQDDVLMAFSAISSGKLDGFVCGENYLKEALLANEDLPILVLDEPVKVFRCGLGLSDSTPVENYVEQVNEAIRELEQNGTLADMERRWLEEEDYTMPEIALPENPAYTLRVATFGKSKPYSYLQGSEVVGFDVELAYRVAAFLGCNVQLECAEYPSMLLGLSEGRYDMVSSNLYISEERAEHVLYSDSYAEQPIRMAVKKVETTVTEENFFDRIADGFRSTFLNDSRWKTILSGLGITLLITFFGFLFANLVGALFCAFAMSKHSALRLIWDIFSRIMQGMPIVVVLLILFYIVFGKSSVSGVVVSIFGLGLASGASLAQQFRGAITSVSKGQREAALALGFTKLETFAGIVFPQALRRLLPGYFSELIALMKGTSIVGYVAVMDLTKAGDMIRSATYDAFFPLISVALIYFLIAFFLLNLLKRIEKRLAPKRMKNEEVSE